MQDLLIEASEQRAMGLGGVLDLGAGGLKFLRALADFPVERLEELMEARWLAVCRLCGAAFGGAFGRRVVGRGRGGGGMLFHGETDVR